MSAPQSRGFRMRHTMATLALSSVALIVLAAGCDAENALVGGSCVDGYTECNLQCVDLTNDSANCGACGTTCLSGMSCGGSVCGGKADGSFSDAMVDGDGDALSHDSSDKDRTFVDADDTDGSVGDGPLTADGNTLDGGMPDGCVPPFDNAFHCGDCFTQCTGLNDSCKASDGGFACAPLCTLPLINCNGVCVDETSDPFNCGACGKFCASNLCSGGLCQGATPGDVVIIGHDYLSTPAAAAQSRVLANAMFIPRSNPLRVLSYERYGEAAAITTVKALLASAATQLNRSITYTVTVTDSDIPTTLSKSPPTEDVLLVYDQKTAGAGVLGALGTSWATTLTSFTKGGGVVIVLDGAAGSPAEMPQFTTNAGLLGVSLHTALTVGDPVNVVAPSDVVGVGVLSPYGAGTRSVRFTADAPSATVTYIVRDSVTNDPVVIHRTVP